ncbi:MAG: response regulator, partial [Desulfosarcina sp.]|nr:response regulator [Desulfobacterales bacterium]
MKFKILVVDDEKDMRILLKRSLEKELNSKVESAPNGETALELVKRKPFDLALVDIRMPGMGGIELLERIKKIDSGLTVVMMTAYGAIEIAVESIKKGAYDFIKKPFEYEDIIRIL